MAHRAVARRHKAIHRAAKHRPSTLAKVGALLAAPLPDVELLIGAMANPDSGIKFVLGIARKAGARVSEVQSVIFDKLNWTADAAKGWLRDHGFSGTAKDEGATFWRFRQQSPAKYREFRTVVPGARQNPYPEEPGGVTRFTPGEGGGRLLRFIVTVRDKVVFQSNDHHEAQLKRDMRRLDGEDAVLWHKGTPGPSYLKSVEYRAENPAPGEAIRPRRFIPYPFENGPEASEMIELREKAARILGIVVAALENSPYAAQISRYLSGALPSAGMQRVIDLALLESGNVYWTPLYAGDPFVQRRPMHETIAQRRAKLMGNPTPGESIDSYQEHLETTTDPDFRVATPGEQAAAMTAQDLCENPTGLRYRARAVKGDIETGQPSTDPDIYYFVITDKATGEIVRRVKTRSAAIQVLASLNAQAGPWYGDEQPTAVQQNPALVSSGERFEALESKLAARPDVEDPRALAAWIGRRKYGTGRFQRIAAKARRTGNPLGTREFLLLDVKHTKSPETLGRIIGVARGQGWQEVVEAAEAKAKRLKIRPETLERHAAKVIPWRNPESAAADLYEEFHGKPPGETLEIVTDRLEHEWLTQLGVLVELKIATLTNLEATIRFDKDAPQLCSSEDGRQLYIEGGDQSIDLKALKMDGEKWRKDSMALGVLTEVTYQTEKGFQKFQLTDYYHHLGEETGVQPFLLYDPNNQLLSVSGGQYEVKPEGLVN